jgi:hypothetical protein
MIDDKKEKCDNCGEKSWFLTYDCIYDKNFCNKCNEVKKPHTDEQIKRAYEKLWKKVKRTW